MLPRIVSGFLLLLFLFNSTGGALAGMLRLWQHQESVAENLSLSSSVMLRFSKNDPRISASMRELSCNGHRYDVISIRHSGEAVLVTCVADAEEDQLLKDFEEESQPAKKKPTLKKQQEEYLPATFTFRLPLILPHFCDTGATPALTAITFAPAAPPPWLA